MTLTEFRELLGREVYDGDVEEKLMEFLHEHGPAVAEVFDYVEHGAWRCHYRERYGACACGLDDLLTSMGEEPLPVNDPEAKT